MRFRYRRYFCRWLATFSRVMPSTFISCRMVFGTAFFTPCAACPYLTDDLVQKSPCHTLVGHCTLNIKAFTFNP